MNELFEFLVHMATDPRTQLNFAHDPAAVLRTAQVAEADQAVAGNTEQITALFSRELSQPANCFVDPGPDPSPDPDPPDRPAEKDIPPDDAGKQGVPESSCRC